jgi:2,5-diketo-D-gluconate reductase A
MSQANVPALTLNDGNRIPQLGFGVWQVADTEAESVVREAIRVGYRHIDTAKIYENEEGVGRAVRGSGVARSELFITTKLWNSDQGRETTLRAFEGSLRRLGLEYVDLYLIHWPAPSKDRYVETWKAMLEIKATGRARAVGVSNFGPEHVERLVKETGVVPPINQIELHPRFAQKHHRAAHQRHAITTESWSPLGQGKILSEPELRRIASKHGKSTAQVILRWHLQHGFVVIPKSVTPSRIAENFDVFGFTLDGSDMAAIDALDSPDGRVGPDPMTAKF